MRETEMSFGKNGRYYEITLQTLLDNGFLNSNKEDKYNGSSNNQKKLINPKTNEEIQDCKISISFDGDIVVEKAEVDSQENCPSYGGSE